MSIIKGVISIFEGIATFNLHPKGNSNKYSIDECRKYIDSSEYLNSLSPETQKNRLEAQRLRDFGRK